MPAQLDEVGVTMLMAMANERERELKAENARLYATIADLRDTVKLYKQMAKDANK